MSCEWCSAKEQENIKACKEAECSYHNTFYAKEMKSELDKCYTVLSEIMDMCVGKVTMGREIEAELIGTNIYLALRLNAEQLAEKSRDASRGDK